MLSVDIKSKTGKEEEEEVKSIKVSSSINQISQFDASPIDLGNQESVFVSGNPFIRTKQSNDVDLSSNRASSVS